MTLRHLAPALLLLCGCASAPAPGRAVSAKERYADELMAIVPPEVMFAQMSELEAQSYALPGKAEKAHYNFMRNVDRSALDAIVRNALLRHFTEPELKALAGFYSTPEGRACMAKVAPFAAEVVPACAHEAAKALRKTAIDSARGMLVP
jgi:hypothetical protein